MRRLGLNKQARRSDFFDSTILVAKRGKVVESFLDAGLIFIFRRRFEKVLSYGMSLMIRATHLRCEEGTSELQLQRLSVVMSDPGSGSVRVRCESSGRERFLASARNDNELIDLSSRTK
jgi:hypothetical protein